MNFEIIDFHTHPFYENSENTCVYKDLVSINFEEDMKAAGVSIFCGSVLNGKSSDFDKIKECNRIAFKLSEIFGKQYIPGIHIHPKFIKESCEEIEMAKRNGGRLIGELVPYYHDYSYADRGLYEILPAAKGMIVSLHTMTHFEMEALAESFKDITFVFAHPGERDSVKNHIEIMKRHENVYLDISGTGLFRYGMLKNLCESVGAERILFGTDYPICNLPMYIGGVLGEKISDREKELIFAGNAKRILNIK